MKELMPQNSDEQDHLIGKWIILDFLIKYLLFKFPEAIKGMDKVADYINEMQRINDLYSPLFNNLMNHSQHEKVKL